jgi:two-component sensor histidine kinase
MDKILAIDDNQDNLVSISALLKHFVPGCTVITAHSGSKGVEIAQREKPDIILLDIQMPEMDGFEVCGNLKAHPETQHIPIAMLTAVKKDSESVIKGLELGADAFLTKPINELELAAQVKVLLRIKKAEDTLRFERDNLESVVQTRTRELKASLQEKETLLQEIHHRVKNNIQIIYSLLSLQMTNLDNEPAKKILLESQRRIIAIATVHEILYESENLSEIDLRTYLVKMSKTLAQSYLVNSKRLNLTIDSETILLDIKKASPIGLVVSELLANSFKFAFPGDATGIISLAAKQTNHSVEISVSDNGTGLPPGFDWRNSPGLGLKLVTTIVEDQLNGTIELQNNGGACFTVRFQSNS